MKEPKWILDNIEDCLYYCYNQGYITDLRRGQLLEAVRRNIEIDEIDIKVKQ